MAWADDTADGGKTAARHIFVYGRVQGVGFRARTVSLARSLGVCGWVRNRSDGSVEIAAEAAPQIIEQFLEKLKKLIPLPG
ncbi:acylphosphatase [Brucepastera parasyntrophica]|uniref:acylphosphatase n=1 Tax=Brucepastera parasyntrophica TaxID=2880008 RepID=UPI00210AE259|nr:acylphosphatase [Brucepastera parasyntrophica]ULQ60720.1 acylphosphatase [Brucepastera parasyntrophica]